MNRGETKSRASIRKKVINIQVEINEIQNRKTELMTPEDGSQNKSMNFNKFQVS